MEGGGRTTVKFDFVKDRPVMELLVNGNEKPFRFIIDTGSGISIISKTTAEQLGVKPVARGGHVQSIGGLGKSEVVYGFLKSVQIGDIRVKNVPVYIREFNSNNEAINGHVGLSLLSNFLTTIDYGNMTFSLTKKDIAGKADAGEDNDISLVLRRTTSGFLSSDIQLEGVEGAWNFIIDTSAGMSIISEKFAGLIEIGRFLREEKIRVTGMSGVIEGVRSFFLPPIILGDNLRERCDAIALNLDSINATSGFQQSGMLGNNFLKNYRLTFDFKNSKVIFRPLK
jgi:predicted aspartyl protease